MKRFRCTACGDVICTLETTDDSDVVPFMCPWRLIEPNWEEVVK